MKTGWNVTEELFTEVSVETGDSAEAGFLLEDAPFREAVREFLDADSGGGREADCSDLESARWITAYSGSDWFDDEFIARQVSLHIPDHITPASRRRVLRLLGAR